MRVILFQIALALLCGSAYGQKDLVIKVLEKYKIAPDVLDDKIRSLPTDFSYDLKETVVTEGKQQVSLAHYDASKSEEDRWTLISSDDKEPSNADIRRFKKQHTKSPTPVSKADDSSFKIDREDATSLVISYLMDSSSVSAETAFLKDCRNFITIDLKTGLLSKVESVNEKPLKIKNFNVSRLNTYGEFTWNETEKRYFPKKNTIAMELKLLGQQLPSTTVMEYSNFKK